VKEHRGKFPPRAPILCRGLWKVWKLSTPSRHLATFARAPRDRSPVTIERVSMVTPRYHRHRSSPTSASPQMPVGRAEKYFAGRCTSARCLGAGAARSNLSLALLLVTPSSTRVRNSNGPSRRSDRGRTRLGHL